MCRYLSNKHFNRVTIAVADRPTGCLSHVNDLNRACVRGGQNTTIAINNESNDDDLGEEGKSVCWPCFVGTTRVVSNADTAYMRMHGHNSTCLG